MIHPAMRAAFADELEKIALTMPPAVGNMARKGFSALKGAVANGWHGLDSAGKAVDGAGWMFSGKGVGKYLPIGGKSMTLLGAASAVPSALAKEDPSGQGRGRTERVMRTSGNILGGLAGTGAIMRTGFGAKHPIIGSLVGGLAGSIAGDRAAGAPFALKRKLMGQGQQRPMPGENDARTAQAPGYGNGVSAMSPNAGQG